MSKRGNSRFWLPTYFPKRSATSHVYHPGTLTNVRTSTMQSTGRLTWQLRQRSHPQDKLKFDFNIADGEGPGAF